MEGEQVSVLSTQYWITETGSCVGGNMQTDRHEQLSQNILLRWSVLGPEIARSKSTLWGSLTSLIHLSSLKLEWSFNLVIDSDWVTPTPTNCYYSYKYVHTVRGIYWSILRPINYGNEIGGSHLAICQARGSHRHPIHCTVVRKATPVVHVPLWLQKVFDSVKYPVLLEPPYDVGVNWKLWFYAGPGFIHADWNN